MSEEKEGMYFSVRFVNPGIPDDPNFNPMSLLERIADFILYECLYASGYRCALCGRPEQLMPNCETYYDVGPEGVICEECREMNKDYYDCRDSNPSWFWDERCS